MAGEPESRPLFIEGDLIAPEAQHLWHVPHATWFTLMGVGGGLFILARLLGLAPRLGIFFGLPVVDLVSFVVIAAGGLVLIADLGRPMRFIRAVMRPGTSWISRGAIADFIFLVVGGILVLPGLTYRGATPLAWLPWDPWARGAMGKAMEVVALLAAVVVIYYAGQVLARPNAIPYWNSPAVPIQFVLSSLAISMGAVMLMETVNGVPIAAGQFWLLLGFLALLLVAIVWHLRTNAAAPGKAESLAQLLRGPFRRAFLWGVVGAGTVLPMILAVIGLAAEPARAAMGILGLLLTLPAGFALRLITLRVGLYAPLRLTLRTRRW